MKFLLKNFEVYGKIGTNKNISLYTCYMVLESKATDHFWSQDVHKLFNYYNNNLKHTKLLCSQEVYQSTVS